LANNTIGNQARSELGNSEVVRVREIIGRSGGRSKIRRAVSVVKVFLEVANVGVCRRVTSSGRSGRARRATREEVINTGSALP